MKLTKFYKILQIKSVGKVLMLSIILISVPIVVVFLEKLYPDIYSIIGFYLMLIVGPVFAFKTVDRLSYSDKKLMVFLSLFCLSLEIFFAVSQISFYGILADKALLYTSYIGFWILYSKIFFLRKGILKYIAILLTLIPIFIFYLASIVGFLAVFLIQMEYKIHYEKKYSDNNLCRVRTYGSSFSSSSGYDIFLIKRYSRIPFLEKTIFSEKIPDVSNSFSPEVECEKIH